MIFFYWFYTHFAGSSRGPAVLGRARLMVGGGFSSLGNWFSGQGSTIIICQRILEKFLFEWKQSIKLVESGYIAFLLPYHLCSRSRHGSHNWIILNLIPVLKSWELKLWLTNNRFYPRAHRWSTMLLKWSFSAVFTHNLLGRRAAPQCWVGLGWWLGVDFHP